MSSIDETAPAATAVAPVPMDDDSGAPALPADPPADDSQASTVPAASSAGGAPSAVAATDEDPADPHARAEQASLQMKPDATMQPETPEQIADEDAQTEAAHVNLLLPRVFLIRHGQSIFNAMHAAYVSMPPKGQQLLNFGGAAGPAVGEGSLIGGIPLMRARQPMTDSRLIDAPLTLLGQQQARDAHALVEKLGIDLVLSTPLTRAIQTSLLVFRPQANNIDWEAANIPSLNQPVEPNVKQLKDFPPEAVHPQIRIIPHHVENLCASCDVGIPLSILRSRFSSEPNIDFTTAKGMMSDCWWSGAATGHNIGHLVIKRAPMSNSRPGSANNSANSSPAQPKSAASSSSSSSSASTSSITLKPTGACPTSGLPITREQSEAIETRTKKLLHYILSLAWEHAQTNEAHRAMNLALVGHCGYFARLSGHNLANCELVELDWGHVFNRQSMKGAITLPAGFKRSDVGDVTKQATIIQHWMEELQPGSTGQSKTNSAGSSSFTASHPPTSTNTASLVPRHEA